MVKFGRNQKPKFNFFFILILKNLQREYLRFYKKKQKNSFIFY